MDIQTQYHVLFSMILVGLFLGAVFESYCQLNKTFKFSKILLHFLDVCYWLMASFLVFAVLYVVAKGEVRFYSLCFVVLGAIIHYMFFRRLTIKITTGLIYIITIIANMVKRIVMLVIYTPIKFIYRLLFRLVCAIRDVIHLIIQRVIKLFKKQQ